MTDEILDEAGIMPYCCEKQSPLKYSGEPKKWERFSEKNNRYDGMDGSIYEFYKCENCNKIFRTTYRRTVKIVSQKEAERMLGGSKN